MTTPSSKYLAPARAGAAHNGGSDRQPPHSIEAEEHLLSCILLDGAEVLSRCLSAGIKPTSFYAAANGVIFERCTTMLAEGKPIEAAAVTEELRTAKQLDQIGGYAFIAQVSSRVPTTAHAKYFIDKVVELHQLRELIRGANRLEEECYSYEGGGVGECVRKPITDLLGLASGGDGQQAREFSEVIKDVEQRVRTFIETGMEPAGNTLSFGWEKADKAFSPMERGELVILAGRPSIGKSSVMRAIVTDASQKGANVLVESLEVRPDQIALQTAATISGVTYKKLPTAHPKEQSAFLAALRGLALPNLHVFSCDRSLAAVIARAKATHAIKPLDLLTIDYLGFVDDCTPSRGETVSQAVGAVTKGLKALATELNCVVVVLAQLNRSSMIDGNREPRLSDLRDSGNIEQDADRVLFVHRPDEDKMSGLGQKDTDGVEDRPAFYQELIQAKGRNVGTGIASFYFTRATTTFRPCAS